MRKLLLLITFVSLNAFNSEIELFENLFDTMFNNKKTIKIYTKNYKKLGANLLVVQSCKKADLVLGELNCSNKPRFLLDYDNFKNDKNAIGAFYWRKGRPQLRLRKNKLLKYKLFIAKEFKEYIN